MIGSINWKNTAENLGLVLVGVIVGVIIGYTVSIRTAERMLEQQKDIIVRAIDKETIKNEIKNDIQVDIDKIKKSDSININIVQTPNNNQKPTNVIIQRKDSIPEKKGFFKRVFGKN